MTTLTYSDVVARLGFAMLCGAALGLNREFHGKPAGVRTQGLVALGAALATLVSVFIVGPGDLAAVTRTIQGIVAGVGFLGAGVIMRGNDSATVHGLTTAAVTWLSACLGIACGAGTWLIAATALGLTLVLLVIGGPFERWAHARFRATTINASREPEP